MLNKPSNEEVLNRLKKLDPEDALLESARNNFIEGVEYFYNNYNLKTSTIDDTLAEAIISLCEYGNKRMLRKLLDDKRSYIAEEAIIAAVISGDPELIDILREYDKSIFKEPDIEFDESLKTAIQEGELDMIEKILSIVDKTKFNDLIYQDNFYFIKDRAPSHLKDKIKSIFKKYIQ